MLNFACAHCGRSFSSDRPAEKLIYLKYECPNCRKKDYLPIQRFVCSNCGNAFYVKKSAKEFAESSIFCPLCEREERPIVYKAFCSSCGELRLLPYERAHKKGRNSFHCLKCGANNQFEVAYLERYVPGDGDKILKPKEDDPFREELAAIDADAPVGATVVESDPVEFHSGDSPRIRRLRADAKFLRDFFHNSKYIHIKQAVGNPPDYYVVEYHVRGVERVERGGAEVFFRDVHQVEIRLDGSYPRSSPQCRMLTPIFHPNIDSAMICVGDDWAAGERLADLIIRVGEIIAYQVYNIKSPLDAFAAQWTQLNVENFPIDSCDLFPLDD